MTRGGAIAMLALGASLMQLGAAFAAQTYGRNPLGALAALVMVAFGAALAGATLGSVVGDAYGRVGGIESTRGVVVWACTAFALTLVVDVVAASVDTPVRPYAMAIATLALALALAPLASVPVLLSDPRIAWRHAFAGSLTRYAGASLTELVQPLCVVVALPVGIPLAGGIAVLSADASCCGLFVVYALCAALPSAATVVPLARLAREAKVAALAPRPSSVVGTLAIGLPFVLALGLTLVLARRDLATSGTWPAMHQVLTILTGGLLALLVWAALEALRYRRTPPLGTTRLPTFVQLRALDVEIDARGEHRLRPGSELLRPDAAPLAVPGLAVDGFAIETAPEAVVDAWIELPPTREATYRVAPTTLPEDAIVHVGSPADAEQRRATRALARVVPWLALVHGAWMVTAGVTAALELDAPSVHAIAHHLRHWL